MIGIHHSDIRKLFDAEILRLLPEMGMTQNDIAWPNAKYMHSPNKGFLRIYLMPGQSSQSSLGPDCLVKLVGVYQISIFQPKDTGMAEAERISAIILNEFPLGHVLECCEQWVIIQQAYCSAAMEDVDYLHLPVSIAYNCHVQQFQNRPLKAM